MRMIIAIFGWIGSKAAIIVAMSSMFIAALSLMFTIEAQKTDKEYKEVAIQPRIMLNAQNDDFAWTMRNVGLGPGVVAEIRMKVGGKCISSNDVNAEEWKAKFQQLVDEMQVDVFSKSFPPMPWVKGGKSNFNTEADMLLEEDVIPAGETRVLMRLDAASLKELKQVKGDEFFIAKQKFAEKAFAVPFAVELCSATGRTCGIVGDAKECSNGNVERIKTR